MIRNFRDAGVKGIAVKTPPAVSVNVAGGFLSRPGWNYDKQDYDIPIANTATRLAGSHEINFGGEFLRSTNNIKNDFRAMGLFNFNGNITGTAMADFMLGDVYQFDQGGGEYKSLFGSRWGFFVQDNWRVTPSLTLTLGLRWDLPPASPRSYPGGTRPSSLRWVLSVPLTAVSGRATWRHSMSPCNANSPGTSSHGRATSATWAASSVTPAILTLPGTRRALPRATSSSAGRTRISEACCLRSGAARPAITASRSPLSGGWPAASRSN